MHQRCIESAGTGQIHRSSQGHHRARQGTRHPDCRRRRGRGRCGLGRSDPRVVRGHCRGPGLGFGHVVTVLEADSRRVAVPGNAGLRAGAGSSPGTRIADPTDRTAPGPAGSVPVPADPPFLGAALRWCRDLPLRHAWPHLRPQPRCPHAQTPLPARNTEGSPEPQERCLRRLHPLLRCTG